MATLSPIISFPKSTKPVGAPKSKFSQFNLEPTRLLGDDYVHKKLLTVKYAGKGSSFIFNGKGTFDLKVGADKREQPVTSSEVKLVTNIDGKNLEAKFDSKGVIRLWANFGSYTLGKPWILTGKLKTNNSFSFWSGNLCLEHQAPQFNIQVRGDLKNGNVPFLNHKLVFSSNDNKCQVGYAAKLNLLAYTLARYNLFAAYHEKKFSVIAEHVSRNKSKFELGKFLFTGIYRQAGNDYALKASYRPHKAEQLRVKVGTVVNVNKETTVKAKINNNTKLTLSGKFKYNSNFTFVLGTQVNLLDPASFLTHRTIPIPLGVSAEFNYA